MELLSELEKCKRCVDLGIADSNRLRTSQKPYVKFEVERKWRPNRVSVLFIAESPPKNGFLSGGSMCFPWRTNKSIHRQNQESL